MGGDIMRAIAPDPRRRECKELSVGRFRGGRMGSGRIAALAVGFVVVTQVAAAQGRDDGPPPSQPKEKLVYADFETVDNGRAVSARGGYVQVTGYQESDLKKTTVKGAGDTNSPELVRIKPDDPNHLAKFEFAIQAPNQWAGASLEIKGQKDADGKTPPDDVSGYKKITFQLYGKGVETVRLEAISRGQGQDLQMGWPQMTFKVKPGLNTYEVALKSLAQPGWVDIKVDPKKILQKLTALTITAYCDQCRPMEGMMIVDNVAFER
jgi:hypothetical protein